MPDNDRPAEQYRQRRRLETDWRFHRGDVEGGEAPDHDDADWKEAEVPHDWSIEGPFDPENPGGNQQGYAPGGVGWYRRDLPEQTGEKSYVQFDGVYRNSDVYLDGEHLGNRPSGYASFQYDLSEHENGSLAVRVDNDEYPHCRWYTGSGIYRDVYLIETDPLHVVPWGTDVRTPAVTDRRASVEVSTEVANDAEESVTCTLVTEIHGPDGGVIATTEDDADFEADEERTFEQRLSIEDPERWSPETPAMYHLRSEVRRDGEPVDDYVTPFGVRTFTFSGEEGFLLNGEPLTLKGVNLHHDAGCLGAAVPERALERRLEILEDMGCNAIRTAHNPPQPELLDLCDEMGFVVIDEAFDKWRHEGTEDYFDEWWRDDLAAMIRRDRNHPSIVCWSVGNENYDQGDESMLDDLEMLAEATSELDPTRPVTYGNPPWGDGKEGVIENVSRVAEHVDVLSGNYQEQWYEDYREAGIDLPLVGSECRPFFLGGGDDPLAYVPENPWTFVAENDDVAGQFIWAGFDYLGEARDWPSRGWATGLIDTTGNPKPEAGYHHSVWSDEPMVQIAAFDPDRDRPSARQEWSWPALSEHWNFPDREDSRGFVHVATFTNGESVELYQNGEWLGEQERTDDADGMIEWYVPYEPGTLRAVAKEDGEVVAEHELETAGEPARIELSIDRDTITADGRDLVYVRATVVDENGIRVPRATHEVAFEATGEGEIVGVDNGDLDSTEPYAATARSAYHGTCTAVVQADRSPGEIHVEATSEGLPGDDVVIQVDGLD